MAVSNTFGFRAKGQDEKLLLMLAEHLERDISDTVRFAIRQTARDFGLIPPKKKPSIVTKVKEGKS